jgi:hypothetical protein
MMLFSFVVVACGGGGADTPAGGSKTLALMGGAMQGSPLSVTGTATSLAGSGYSFGWTDGTGSSASFDSPFDITTDGTNLFVPDRANANIRKIVIATGIVTTLAGPDNAICSANITTVGGVTKARCPHGLVNGTGTAARFNNPSSITMDGTSLYVGDDYYIRKIVIATGEVTTLAGSSIGYLDGVGATAKFAGISSITTDNTNLYVADFANIRKVVIATGEVSTIAGPGAAQTGGNIDGIGSAARFSGLLHGMTTDGVNVYLADGQNNSIRKIVIATGDVTTLATGLSQIQCLTSDGTSLYTMSVSDTKKIVIASGMVSTVSGSGSGNGLVTDGTSLYVDSGAAGIVYRLR